MNAMTLVTCSSSGRLSSSAPRAQIVARDVARKRLVLHPLDHRRRLEVEHALRRPDQRGGGDEASHLVAGIQRLLERGSRARRPSSRRATGSRASPIRDSRGAAALAAPERMVGRRLVALVVEIVQQRDRRPMPPRLRRTPCVAAHRRFDRQRVLAQALALGPFGQQRPRGVAGVRQSRPWRSPASPAAAPRAPASARGR